MSFFFRKKPQPAAQPQQNSTVGQAPSQALVQLSQPQQNLTVRQAPSQPLAMLSDGYRSAGSINSQQLQEQQRQQQEQQQQRQFPWATRRITLPPPVVLNNAGFVPPTSPSPSPFPRYGLALPATSTLSGDLYIFGGLGQGLARNDLYLFNPRDYSATLLQTSGEIPSPRFGHASAIVSNLLIVWGGNTKTDVGPWRNEKQDDAIYLLNLALREWSRVTVYGPAPPGRYGHTLTMASVSKFYVFGGQVDYNGEFLDDLWAFDLNSRRTTKAVWQKVECATDLRPPRRSGHICVTHGDRLIIFGGTNARFHLNDTWAFDLNTKTWAELSCVGFVPLPREGHAAALVDDVIYVFGGRAASGIALGDLAAFEISNQRWHTFQNMGPAPSGRSGHAMASIGSRVYVLGGEPFLTPANTDEPDIIYVLDTKHIKYPNPSKSSVPNPQQQNSPRETASMPQPVQQTPSNNVVTSAPAIESSGFAQWQTVASYLHFILLKKDLYKLLLSQTGDQAQSLLNLLHQLLDLPDVAPRTRLDFLMALVRLSRKTGLYPECLVLTGLDRVGEYPVAAGSFGEVWQGVIREREVSVKIVKVYLRNDAEKLLKAFYHEAILWSQLDHPNILPLYGIYFLDDYVKNVPDADYATLLLDIARGLEYLHDNKIAHGDLKGVNILVTPSARACIMDFGLSTIADPQILSWTSLASSSGHGGSVRWQAPEILNGDTPGSFAGDVYAYACVCYEIFSGTHPFSEFPKDGTVILRVLSGTRPNRPSSNLLSEQMWQLMQDCWRADPTNRPTITEVATRISTFPKGTDVEPARNEWDKSFPRFLRKSLRGATLSLTLEELRAMFPGAYGGD